MAETSEASYLSIGEVLGLLLEEFPDVTISKIRFLESQGLISPERTSSGYRKFYDDDVDLLRVILTEQRRNYLPLRVIKDRLETGEIDPTGEHLRPALGDVDPTPTGTPAGGVEQVVVPADRIAAHPASRQQGSESSTAPDAGAAALLPGVLLDRRELCAMVGITEAELAELESFSIVAPQRSGGGDLYGDDAVEVARFAGEFLRAGVDARHLRAWRTAAEREAGLFEQIVTPRFRQRNPEARAEALAQLRALDALGARLRAAMMRQVLRHHFES